MVSRRSIWCNSFCAVFVGIQWTLSLWSDLFYPWNSFEFWSLICMISYSLIFLLWIFGLVRPTRSIFLATGRGALWWVRSYGAWSQWQKELQGTYCIVAIEDNKMFFYHIHEFIPLHHVILLKALLCSYELNTLNACWIAVDVWSNSSRCRQESVY